MRRAEPAAGLACAIIMRRKVRRARAEPVLVLPGVGWIILGIDIDDVERSNPGDLQESLARRPGVVVHLRSGGKETAGPERLASVLSSLSPMPTLNVPEITVTFST